MRAIITSLVIACCLIGLPSHAAESLVGGKVKTGILPSGGFYSIYEVACHEQPVASIARIERGRRWCTSYDGELNCFSRQQQAVASACVNDKLALVDEVQEVLALQP